MPFMAHSEDVEFFNSGFIGNAKAILCWSVFLS